MLKNELFEKVAAVKTETKDALQLVFNELNNGQQKKLLKNEDIKKLLDRYGVIYSE